MKKLFFCSIILSAFVFTNCKKEDTSPSLNQLIVVDRNGNTTVSKPMDTNISGSFDPSFGVSATSASSSDYSFSMGFPYGEPGSNITFNSTGQVNGITMWVNSMGTGVWMATGGTANIETKSGSALFGGSGTKFMKVTFNNVQFTRAPYLTPAPPADTIWVSGIVNAKR